MSDAHKCLLASCTQVEASSCGMGIAGAKAFGDALRVNKTLQHLNVSNNSFGRVQKGEQVKLKRSGEVCTVHQYYWDDPSRPCITLPNGSTKNDVKASEFEWESQVPAFCAGLAASVSLLSVSDAVGGCCAPVALEGDIFEMKSFSQLAVTFLCGASFTLFWSVMGLQLQYGVCVRPILILSASKAFLVC